MMNVSEGKQLQTQIGMNIMLISWAMMFATLFMGYALFRVSSDVWPPMGMPRAPLFWPSLSTVIAIASSATFELYRNREQNIWWFLSFGLGLAFLASQYQVWSFFNAQGLEVSMGIFPSILIGFTWIHAGHIALALLSLLWAWFRGKNLRVHDRKNDLVILNIAKFWHFLAIIWLAMYFALFVF